MPRMLWPPLPKTSRTCLSRYKCIIILDIRKKSKIVPRIQKRSHQCLICKYCLSVLCSCSKKLAHLILYAIVISSILPPAYIYPDMRTPESIAKVDKVLFPFHSPCNRLELANLRCCVLPNTSGIPLSRVRERRQA